MDIYEVKIANKCDFYNNSSDNQLVLNNVNSKQCMDDFTVVMYYIITVHGNLTLNSFSIITLYNIHLFNTFPLHWSIYATW